MIELRGKYNEAKIYTDVCDNESISQILSLLNQPFIEGSKIRMMPDVHAGAGCTIGTTTTIADKIVPNLVGVDIGCGMLTTVVSETKSNPIDFNKLDTVIRENIPSGMNVRETEHEYTATIYDDLKQLKCVKSIDLERALLSLGTLGGGNHFIEVDVDKNGTHYLVIHSGSRYLGKQVAEHYQKLAYDRLTTLNLNTIRETVERMKREGRQTEIEAELKRIKAEAKTNIPPKGLEYLCGSDTEDYLHDMKIVQTYAKYNRKAMSNTIFDKMNWISYRERADIPRQFQTIHNYIDINARILRKGAVSAGEGEILLIPINMRDGSLICKGKGNPDWNCSAPHGAGRLMSRREAKDTLSMEEFTDTMKNVFSTTVCKDTIDESPMAYKSINDIVDNIGPTADIIEIIKPVYNYKASE